MNYPKLAITNPQRAAILAEVRLGGGSLESAELLMLTKELRQHFSGLPYFEHIVWDFDDRGHLIMTVLFPDKDLHDLLHVTTNMDFVRSSPKSLIYKVGWRMVAQRIGGGPVTLHGYGGVPRRPAVHLTGRDFDFLEIEYRIKEMGEAIAIEWRGRK